MVEYARMAMQHLYDYSKVTPQVTTPLASYGLPVAGRHHVEDRTLDGCSIRVVVPDWTAGEDYCWPVHEPHVVEDFARVRDEQSLLRFNDYYGLLGYNDICQAEMPPGKEDLQGDPVDWALAHARVAAGMLGAIRIIGDVRSGRVKLHSLAALHRALGTQFEKIGLRGIFAGEPHRCTGFAWSRPEALLTGSKEEIEQRFFPRWQDDPIGTAYRILAWILNFQIARIHFEFISYGHHAPFLGGTEPEPRFGLELRWKVLLQVIYWKLAEHVGGAFRQCPKCGLVFPMRTPKDRFCSRRCLDAFKSKEWRDRKRKEREQQKKRRKR
jgi:hypothetical protein